jgi:hypothetical protein
MPLRVSLVAPDFEMTTVNVRPRSPPISAKVRSMPSGSVLSKKKGRIGSSGEPRAPVTNIGPSAEPPMPTRSILVNLGAPAGRILPVCTSEANARMRARVSVMASRIAAVGASDGFRSQ